MPVKKTIKSSAGPTGNIVAKQIMWFFVSTMSLFPVPVQRFYQSDLHQAQNITTLGTVQTNGDEVTTVCNMWLN